MRARVPPIPPLVSEDGPIGPLYRFPALVGCERLLHVVTGAPANMATHLGPDREQAAGRRRAICESLGLRFEQLTSTCQVHGAEVFLVDPTSAGTGRGVRDGTEPAADALATDVPGVALLALSADCPLILVFDPSRPAVGLAHASWKGTVAGVARGLVETMRRTFGCDPRTMVAAIAPSAGPCCYEVGDDVVTAVARSLPNHEQHLVAGHDRPHFDLWSANTAQLIEAGLSPEAVTAANVCTICDRRFFSYRRDGGGTGRFAFIAAIREDPGA